MTSTIQRITAIPISFSIPEALRVRLGIGLTVKRDAVLVRVDTSDGVVGWGEAHAARAPTAIAELINTTLAGLVTGMDATDTEAVWERVYRGQLASHGTGAAAAIGLSGIDLALWDIRGKLAGKPVYALLGGERRGVPAYAGGIALGFEPPAALAEEALGHVAVGYRALKLRFGEAADIDVRRLEAVRAALDSEVEILVDANTAYGLGDVRAVAPALAANRVGWLEEPFPAHDWRRYQAAAAILDVPLAAGENHYTRFDFERVAADGAIRVWQPDLSKTGGLTEGLRIARLAAEHGIRVHPHTSLTALNMAASLHFLAAIPNAGYFEADVSRHNPLRDVFEGADFAPDAAGELRPPDGPGLGVAPDAGSLAAFPAMAGAGYV
ncbi:MAG: mandelate racemase/muconate lactonizing enzyme family protein [Gammaproteobacteria bacterium]